MAKMRIRYRSISIPQFEVKSAWSGAEMAWKVGNQKYPASFNTMGQRLALSGSPPLRTKI